MLFGASVVVKLWPGSSPSWSCLLLYNKVKLVLNTSPFLPVNMFLNCQEISASTFKELQPSMCNHGKRVKKGFKTRGKDDSAPSLIKYLYSSLVQETFLVLCCTAFGPGCALSGPDESRSGLICWFATREMHPNIKIHKTKEDWQTPVRRNEPPEQCAVVSICLGFKHIYFPDFAPLEALLIRPSH